MGRRSPLLGVPYSHSPKLNTTSRSLFLDWQEEDKGLNTRHGFTQGYRKVCEAGGWQSSFVSTWPAATLPKPGVTRMKTFEVGGRNARARPSDTSTCKCIFDAHTVALAMPSEEKLWFRVMPYAKADDVTTDHTLLASVSLFR